MIDLYHHGMSVCAAKVRFALGEKKIAWESRYVDLHKGDQFAPDYVKLNPKAVVPTLLHDGHVVVESTVINEYIDEVFPDVPLKPSDPSARAAMRVWTKAIDEDLHPACAEVTFSSCLRHVIKRLPPKQYEEYLASTPLQSVTPHWHERKKQLITMGFNTPGLGEKYRLYDSYLDKMEKALAQRAWLAADTFSLADIAMTPYVNRLDMLGMSKMWEKSRPRVTEWFERVKARPAFKPALLDWCPPHLTADMSTYGPESWPNVERFLAQAS
jgi:glutathione S-transferase